MTVYDVRARVERIRQVAVGNVFTPSRDAFAHGEEDELHRDVLAAIAAGDPDPELLAAEALKSVPIKFSRWYE